MDIRSRRGRGGVVGGDELSKIFYGNSSKKSEMYQLIYNKL
jgi:hypothetical protein